MIVYKQIRPQQVFTCCVMDSSDELITFDENGVYQRCREYKSSIRPNCNFGAGKAAELNALINDIKHKGQGMQYDCILGLSGGLDSSYMLHLAVKEWGLRPYVFHIDAGWNLPVATENIKKICNKLNLELHVEKMDREEMRQMQLAFFRTGHAGLDAPQDHAFIALIDKLAGELGVKPIMIRTSQLRLSAILSHGTRMLAILVMALTSRMCFAIGVMCLSRSTPSLLVSNTRYGFHMYLA